MGTIYKSILNDAHAGFWHWNIRDSSLEYVSPSFSFILGYENDNLPPTPSTWRSLVYAEDLPLITENIRKHIESRAEIPFQCQVRFVHKNGSIVWIFCTGHITEWDEANNPIRLIGFAMDVSKQKQTEDSFKISQDQFAGAFEFSAIGMALVSTEGKWLKVNKQVCELLGYTEQELLATTFQQITHPDDLELDLLHVDLVLKGSIQNYRMEKRYFHKNGSIIWGLLSVSLVRDIDGCPLHFISQIEDVTEKKKIEDEIKQRDILFSRLSDQIPGSLYQFQLFPNGRSCVPFVTKGVWELFQLRAEDIKDDSSLLFNKICKEDFEGFYASILESFHTLKRWEYEFRVQLSGDQLKWIHGISQPEKQPDGSVLWHGYVTDITHRKQTEQELVNSFNIISNQNKRLINFAHIVSHNLRSHSGNLEMILDLLDTIKAKEEREKMMESLKSISASLSETINNLNEVVSVHTNKNVYTEPLNLKKCLEKALSTLAEEINTKGGTITDNIPDDIILQYNPDYLQSILTNFLSNSIKYSDPERKPAITIDAYDENGQLVLRIADNGIGINLERHGEKLFGLYKTFHGNKDAKGLGLFLTKNQVEAMGGHIEVESNINAGTVFKVYFV